MARVRYRRGCGCGGCFTVLVGMALAGAIWTYLLTGNGRWITLGAAVAFVAYRVAKRVRRRARDRRAKTRHIALGAIWAARNTPMEGVTDDGR